MSERPPQDLLDRVEAMLGRRPRAWTRAVGGYSAAERWSLELPGGDRVFAKMAVTDDLAWRLRDEHANMTALPADLRCEVVGFQDGDRPLLVLEDLSGARWPPPWEPGDEEKVLAALERLWSAPRPGHLPGVDRLEWMFAGWERIAEDPEPFLSLGLVSREWLRDCLPALREAAAAAPLSGKDVLHMDVRSDNMCFDGDRVVLVDWNWASVGPRELDVACWLPSLRLEGGPLPEEVAPGLGVYASALSSYFADGAPQPPQPGAPTVRHFQLRQLRISLPWACRELGLPLPDRAWAMEEVSAADADLAAGAIDEAEWYRRVEEPLIDAYLSSDDPRAQSGKGGDETDWRWARELVLEVFPPRAAFLDVGCANGYLMESLHRWGAERGIDVEPYGLDISWRIAALARRRLPQWADRIFVGNALEWEPPRRFDVVQLGVDEVPVPRRRELLDRVLSGFLVPGGRAVLRAGRAGSGFDPERVLGEIGVRPDGIIESAHPRTGELRRTAWIAAPVA